VSIGVHVARNNFLTIWQNFMKFSMAIISLEPPQHCASKLKGKGKFDPVL